MMQLSPYTLSFPHPDEPDSTVLFACKTGALVVLDHDDFEGIRQGRIPAESLADLIEMGLTVEDPEADRAAVQGYLTELNRLNPNLTVAVVLGLDCNFACRYCFEGKQKGGGAMSDETADRLVAYLKQRFTEGKTRLQLEVYGGEPLLYVKRLVSLASQLKPFVEERGGELLIPLVSNGSLLTPQLVDELNRWGLEGVKVTIDGPPENHNRFRPLKNGGPSFERIVANLAQVCDKTRIRLGGNYTADNYHDFATVLDLLAEAGIGPDQLEHVNFNIVMRIQDKIANNEYLGGCASINEPWLVAASLKVREEVYKRGYRIPEIGPTPCAVEMDDAFTVNWDGGLYKCVTWAGHEAYRIGDLRQGISKGSLENHYLWHWQQERECRECRYLPLCFGGCRYMAYQREGSMAKVDCRKPYYDAALIPMLLQDLKYRYGRAG